MRWKNIINLFMFLHLRLVHFSTPLGCQTKEFCHQTLLGTAVLAHLWRRHLYSCQLGKDSIKIVRQPTRIGVIRWHQGLDKAHVLFEGNPWMLHHTKWQCKTYPPKWVPVLKRKVFSSGTPAALQIYYIGGDDGILGGAYRGICTYISIHI